MPFGATADTCADTADCSVSQHSAVRCRLQCIDVEYIFYVKAAVYLCTCRGVRTANLNAVRSAITATAELLVGVVSDCLESERFIKSKGSTIN